jgi:hypothetical protein
MNEDKLGSRSDLPLNFIQWRLELSVRECTGICRRRFVAERGVWPRGVVVGDPGPNELAGLIEIHEQGLVEKRVRSGH